MRFSIQIALWLILTCTQTLASPKVKIFVSTLPQKYFFDQIGADHIDISVLVGPGQSPATYDPTPKQMVELASAQLYQRIGVPFERIWMTDISKRIPNLKIVDAREGIKLLDIEASHKAHSDSSKTDHGKDPHIWTDPQRVKKIANQILKNLIELDPKHKTNFKNNYHLFIQRMDILDKRIQNTLSNIKSHRFMVFHPSWGYFADRYKLQQIPVEHEGKSPSAQSLTRLIETARTQNINSILVQKQFSQRSAKILAKAFGGRAIIVDPLAYNYPESLEHVANAIAGTSSK